MKDLSEHGRCPGNIFKTNHSDSLPEILGKPDGPQCIQGRQSDVIDRKAYQGVNQGARASPGKNGIVIKQIYLLKHSRRIIQIGHITVCGHIISYRYQFMDNLIHPFIGRNYQ